ncbi:MAG: OmpH family outer membrane protein [Deltaproteobacteria bacterium]|nr:OmpH family outer membrane protein [Deltaproteobacteria bacterium]
MHASLRMALPVVGLALGLVASPPAAADSMKIAVVDTQRAVLETEEGLRTQAALKKHFDKRQKDLDDKQVSLQKEREDIEKQKGVLSKAALEARVEKWQRDMAELQTVFVDYNKELQKKQSELTQPIFQKAMGIIRRLATQNGYDMIVDRQAVPYFRSDLDLTDRVITEYNQASGAAPAGSGAPAAAPAPAAPPPAKK